jgi:hypothetical protein
MGLKRILLGTLLVAAAGVYLYYPSGPGISIIVGLIGLGLIAWGLDDEIAGWEGLAICGLMTMIFGGILWYFITQSDTPFLDPAWAALLGLGFLEMIIGIVGAGIESQTYQSAQPVSPPPNPVGLPPPPFVMSPPPPYYQPPAETKTPENNPLPRPDWMEPGQ